MAEIKESLGLIYKGISEAAKECGLSPVYPEGADKNEVPVIESGNTYRIEYKGEEKGAKIEFFNNTLALYGANKEGEILSSDYTQLALSLFEPAEATDKDIRYFVNDFSDTLRETFGAKSTKQIKTKLPTPVSKAQAKSGMVSYDPNTLASRFTTIYPELREEYKNNCEKYGTFLPEDFFMNYGTPLVIEVIKRNNPTEMKKLFKLFNEIFDDGTNNTQSLICVTILGALENNMELLANCTDYMNDDLAKAVISVNKYLWSDSGKGARMKLENPPKYKPKKQKTNIMSKLGM